MDRTVILVAALWALVVAPALCTGGVLHHECDCGTAIGCEHEDDCANDPCATATVRGERRPSDLGIESYPALSWSPAVLACLEAGDRGFGVRGLDVPLSINLPYAASDRPLLM